MELTQYKCTNKDKAIDMAKELSVTTKHNTFVILSDDFYWIGYGEPFIVDGEELIYVNKANN